MQWIAKAVYNIYDHKTPRALCIYISLYLKMKVRDIHVSHHATAKRFDLCAR